MSNISYKNKRVAIICDWIKDWGGAEIVLSQLIEIFPHADIFTSIFYQSENPLFQNYEIVPSGKNQRKKISLKFIRALFRKFLTWKRNTNLLSHFVLTLLKHLISLAMISWFQVRAQRVKAWSPNLIASRFATVIHQLAIFGVIMKTIKIWWSLEFLILLQSVSFPAW